jgi:ribonuclease J
MQIEIATIGGYNEVGRNMTAVQAGENIVIFDMGLNLSQILIHDDVQAERMHSLDLIDMGAIPDDRVMSDLEGEVQAIVLSHGHLDHIGAVGKLAHRYDAPIVASPFTIELAKEQIEDEDKFHVDNELVPVDVGDSFGLPDDLEVEFVNVTHSILHATNPVLHTPEGAIVYGLDKRIDHTPPVDQPFDVERFREIANDGVLAYIEDCTNEGRTGRTPSEAYAQRHLEDVMTSVENYDGGIVATTFASHVSRVKSLVENARNIGREPILIGRSMEKYSGAADRLGMVDFLDDVGMYGHRRAIEQALERVMKEGKENFLPIVTGHQGEPRAMLTRMGRDETPYQIDEGDKVIFAARVIPEPSNEAQRHQSETLLKMQGARIYDDIHVSGHLSAEGQYEMLKLLQPDHVVPAHQDLSGMSEYVELAESEGYRVDEDLHISRNGNTIQIVE